MPIVEVADHRNLASIGRPDGKDHAVDAVETRQMSPQFFIGPFVRSFADQVSIKIAQPIRRNSPPCGDFALHCVI